MLFLITLIKNLMQKVANVTNKKKGKDKINVTLITFKIVRVEGSSYKNLSEP
jgi:hypothetical protein